jgi:hypothetical protein
MMRRKSHLPFIAEMSHKETERTIRTNEIKRTTCRAMLDQAGPGHGTAKRYFEDGNVTFGSINRRHSLIAELLLGY